MFESMFIFVMLAIVILFVASYWPIALIILGGAVALAIWIGVITWNRN